MPSFRSICMVAGALVVIVVICHVAGDPMIEFIHWAQSIGVSHK